VAVHRLLHRLRRRVPGWRRERLLLREALLRDLLRLLLLLLQVEGVWLLLRLQRERRGRRGGTREVAHDAAPGVWW